MADVVRGMPAVSDALRFKLGLEIDWLVDAPFAAIPALHAGVREVIPVHWDQWKKALHRRETWHQIGELKDKLRAAQYDLVIDLQGQVRSAIWARMAQAPVVGYDKRSACEPMAALLYVGVAPVSKAAHAVSRYRRLLAHHLGYPFPASAPDFGLQAKTGEWIAPEPYAVLVPCASRAEKLWPSIYWRDMVQNFADRGWTTVVMWVDRTEELLAKDVAAETSAIVPPLLSVADAAHVLAGAQAVVGLDTGYTHLGAALARPGVGVFCDSDPGEAGLAGSNRLINVGGKRKTPTLAEVERAFELVMAQSS